MGKFSKGYIASVGGIVTSAVGFSEQFCGSWVPAAVAFFTAVGVLVVPNAAVSDPPAVRR